MVRFAFVLFTRGEPIFYFYKTILNDFVEGCSGFLFKRLCMDARKTSFGRRERFKIRKASTMLTAFNLTNIRVFILEFLSLTVV